MKQKPSVPHERVLFANYKLWRKYVDPDGLVSASEFREMDEDEKREALRELGGAHPAVAGPDDPVDPADDDEEELDDIELDEEDDKFVELSDDIVDPRSE